MRGSVTGDRGNSWLTVNLLQMVMVSPGTHLVKNFESQSRTNESQFKKKKKSLKLKMLGATDSKTLYYSVTVY